MSDISKQPVDFEQMMNEGLKQFDDRRQTVDWLSHGDCKKLINSISSVVKCSPETSQSCMCI